MGVFQDLFKHFKSIQGEGIKDKVKKRFEIILLEETSTSRHLHVDIYIQSHFYFSE